ncbi:MAG: hypothetical protein E7588_05480 [Ruminococcaceae bacterium]|nr:hypothetical protein [Oscillospiraceae bacterium]
MNKTKQFAVNALITTATSIIISAVSMGFTVFLSSRIGADGMGLYQLIMTVYRLAVTFATGGIGLAASRLVSEEAAVGNRAGCTKAVRNCLFYASTLSLFSGALLFVFSEKIALSWLGDIRTLESLKILAFSLPALSCSSVLCGYFTAMRKTVKNSAVLMLEQYIKISLSAFLLSYLATDLQSACCILVLSGTSAEILSFITLFILYLADRRKEFRVKNPKKASDDILNRMLSIALPVALTSYLRSGLSSVEQMMIPWGLKKYGHSESASLAEYGVIGGMAMPVIMLPAVFISGFSGLLVTEIAACRAVDDKARINRIFSFIFRYTLVFSVAVAGILCVFGGEIAMAMYKNSRAAYFVKILAPLVCVMYLDSVTDSMLKGLNLQKNHMRYNLIDSAVSVILTVTLLPAMGIGGYIIVITVSEALNFFLSFRRLLIETGFEVHIFEDIIKPAICITVSLFIMHTLSRFMHFSLPLALIITLTLLLYALLLGLMGCITREDGAFVRRVLK